MLVVLGSELEKLNLCLIYLFVYFSINIFTVQYLSCDHMLSTLLLFSVTVGLDLVHVIGLCVMHVHVACL